MKKSAKKLIILFSVIVFMIAGCVDSTDVTSSSGNISIKINSPKSNDTIGIGTSTLNYSVVKYSGVSFLQLFVNNTYVRDIVPSSSGVLPAVTLAADSAMIGSRISFFLIYYDLNGSFCFSDTVTNVLITESYGPPYTPYNFKLRNLPPSNGHSTVNLYWSDSSRGVTGYEIYRRVSTQSTYDTIIVAEPGSFNVNDSSLAPGVTYYYKIRGINTYGPSGFTTEISTTGSGGASSIKAPSNVVVKALGPRVIRLTWKDNSSNENYFGIERRYTFSDFQQIGIVKPDVVSFVDSAKGLSAGTEYYYRIKAYSSFDSSWSDEVYAQTPVYQPKAPTLTSLKNTSSTTVVITWKDNETHFTTFQIYRREGNEAAKMIAEATDYTGQYTDETVTPGRTLYYKILSTDGTFSSEFSNEDSITTAIVPPETPVITLAYCKGGGSFYIGWDFTGYAKNFLLEARVSGTTSAAQWSVEGTLKNTTFKNGIPNTDYEFRIRAVDDYTVSNWSDWVLVDGW